MKSTSQDFYPPSILLCDVSVYPTLFCAPHDGQVTGQGSGLLASRRSKQVACGTNEST